MNLDNRLTSVFYTWTCTCAFLQASDGDPTTRPEERYKTAVITLAIRQPVNATDRNFAEGSDRSVNPRPDVFQQKGSQGRRDAHDGRRMDVPLYRNIARKDLGKHHPKSRLQSRPFLDHLPETNGEATPPTKQRQHTEAPLPHGDRSHAPDCTAPRHSPIEHGEVDSVHRNPHPHAGQEMRQASHAGLALPQEHEVRRGERAHLPAKQVFRVLYHRRGHRGVMFPLITDRLSAGVGIPVT